MNVAISSPRHDDVRVVGSVGCAACIQKGDRLDRRRMSDKSGEELGTVAFHVMNPDGLIRRCRELMGQALYLVKTHEAFIITRPFQIENAIVMRTPPVIE